jgi:peptide/nickel transport system substrate-binding protein
MRGLASWIAATAAVAVTSLIAPLAVAQDTPARGGTLRSLTSGYRTLNPAVQSGLATAMPGAQIFAGLVEIGEAFKPMPYLAQSWVVSADGLTHTFKLVDGATFHDGKPISAADVVYSMQMVKKYHPFGPIMHGNLQEITAPDAATVVFKHAQPAPFFLQTLAPHLMPVLPKHVYDDGQDLNTHPKNTEGVVGSGPFKVVEHKVGQHLILERHEGFFRKGRPYLDKVAIITQKDATTRLLTFEKGEAEYIPWTGFTERDVRRLEKQPGLQLIEKGYEGAGHVNYMELNLRRKPFDDVRVRQAIAHAIDTDFISKTLFLGTHTPAHGIIHPSNPFYSADVPRFQGGIEKAKELLDAAGLAPDASGTRFKMTLDVASFSAQAGMIGDYIRPQLKKIGIDVTLRKAPDFGTWAQRIASWDYDGVLNSVWNYPDPVIGLHRLFSCKNIRNQIWTNTQGYCNEKVDALMAKAAVTLDMAERKKLYQEFAQITSSEQAMVYLTFQAFQTGQQANVKGAPIGAWGGLGPWDGIYLVKK